MCPIILLLLRSVGMIFMPNDDALEAQCKAIYEGAIAQQGLKLLGWRAVPVRNEVVGRFAKATQPRVWQVMVEGKGGMTGDELERELFVLRKAVEKEKDSQLPEGPASDFYTCSLSNRTIVYKVRGLMGGGANGLSPKQS
jgi:glutamate synthase (ferredoxin)